MKYIKRFLFLFILGISITFIISKEKESNATVGASYLNYSSITLSKGRMLSTYDDGEINSLIKKNCKRKFLGWRISYINKRVRCNFVSETVLTVYNTGSSAIKYKVAEQNTKVYKVSISATNSISVSAKGDIKKFKADLSDSLKISGEYSQTVEIKNSESLELEVDPKTKMTMYLAGTGYLYTGVARYYKFFIGRYKGGFEYFQVSDLYTKIVKVAI